MTNFKTKKSYFKNDPKFGRSTQLIDVKTGEVVYECIGTCSKSDLIASMNYSKKIQKETKLTLDYAH